MNPTPPLTYVKFGLLALLVVGIFVLAALGKIDASTAVDKATTGMAALLVALGLGSMGVSIGRGAQPNAAPSPAEAKPLMRGFVRLRTLFAIAALGLVGLVLAACPQAVKSVPPALDCGTLVLDEALAGKTFEEIVADAGPRCGLDVLQIIAQLTAPTLGEAVKTTHAAAQARDLKARMLPDAGK